MIDDVPEILADIEIYSKTGNRILLNSQRHTAVVRLDYDGQSKHWLMTAFEKDEFRSPEKYGRRGEDTAWRSTEKTDAQSSASPTRSNVSDEVKIDKGGDRPDVLDQREGGPAQRSGDDQSNSDDEALLNLTDPGNGFFARLVGKERRRPRGGVTAKEGSETPEISRLREVGEALAKALKIPSTRQGHIQGSRRTLGQYYIRYGGVRLRSLDDFETLTHEYGHHLDNVIPEVKAFIKRNSLALKPLDYDPQQGRDYEGFAEFFRFWLTNRPYLEKNFPDLTAEFIDVMAEYSDLVDGIDNAKFVLLGQTRRLF